MEPSQIFSSMQYHMTQQEEDGLIDLWESNEFLYNKTMEGYQNRQRREKCFDSISRALDIPGRLTYLFIVFFVDFSSFSLPVKLPS